MLLLLLLQGLRVEGDPITRLLLLRLILVLAEEAPQVRCRRCCSIRSHTNRIRPASAIDDPPNFITTRFAPGFAIAVLGPASVAVAWRSPRMVTSHIHP